MKIVGTHDEILYLKMTCQKMVSCERCVLNTFCHLEGVGSNPLGLFSMEKIQTVFIGKDGENVKKSDKESS